MKCVNCGADIYGELLYEIENIMRKVLMEGNVSVSFRFDVPAYVPTYPSGMWWYHESG